MGTQLLEQVVAGEAPGLFPITIEHYLKMLEAGIFQDGDPVELIDGCVVWKDRRDSRRLDMIHGPDHVLTVKRLFLHVYDNLVGQNCHAQCQLPVSIPPKNAPEPDVSVIAGRPEDYRERLPSAADALAVMEVADSSLRFDRSTKLQLYAGAGIAVYVLVDLVAHRIDVHTQPTINEGRYAHTRSFKVGETIHLELAGGLVLELPVSEILP